MASGPFQAVASAISAVIVAAHPRLNASMRSGMSFSSFCSRNARRRAPALEIPAEPFSARAPSGDAERADAVADGARASGGEVLLAGGVAHDAPVALEGDDAGAHAIEEGAIVDDDHGDAVVGEQQYVLGAPAAARKTHLGKRNSKKGLATLCIGGGMGIAMCVER